MEWIYVRDELPPRGKEVFIIRGWEGGQRHLRKAARLSSEPLTISDDFSTNCWWKDDEKGSSFCDGTVVAWLKVPEISLPEFEGVKYDRD